MSSNLAFIPHPPSRTYQHVCSCSEELLPDPPALVGNIALGQLLHVPHGLDEEQVLGGVLLLQERLEVVVTYRVFQKLPAAETPSLDPSLGYLIPVTLLEHVPELGGVRYPRVTGFRWH